ncbi:MAG: hypothetical protein H6Q10_568 [Acidobacteria bacterium]|nr:hypothetical protein [Acidobacteriota bacterium]
MSDDWTGARGRAEREVTAEVTARAFGSGLVPVFATPAMVALMEEASVDALAGRLAAGETTVGTRLEVSHLAATPIGDRVRAEAVLVGREGRRLIFDVTAWDSSEKIGEGRHERAVISRDRFLARVQAKARR